MWAYMDREGSDMKRDGRHKKPRFKVKWCDFCEVYYVVCPKCGNNCCNGGHGTLPNGRECKVCPAAYEYQKHINPETGRYEDMEVK